MINIIKNSLQAVEETEDTGRIGIVKIVGIRNNGYYSLKISDNGTGMDDETQNKLFEPYFSTKSSGMGLGLVITKKIFDDMNAEIKVNSTVGKGTDVEINFRLKGN